MGIFLGTEKRAASLFPVPPVPAFLGLTPGGLTPSIATQPDTALTVPTVWACVSLVAGTVSSLRLETFRKAPDGAAKRVDDPSLIVSPSSGMTQSEWLHMLVVSLLLRGNAVGRISSRNRDDGRPTSIDLIHPDTVRAEISQTTGEVVWRYLRTNTVIPTEDVWHVPWLTLPGSKLGLSPVAYAAAVLETNISARQFALDFFNGGGIPKAVLKTTEAVNQEQATTLKNRLMASFRAREPIVLGSGTEYQAIQVRPEESQFLATQQADVAQIARYFGVPPEMVGGSSGTSMTYSNVEQRSLDFLTYGLAPLLRRIEDAIFPLLAGQQFVKFRVDDLLRTDAHTQATVDVLLVAGKISPPSEVRRLRGLPPLTKSEAEELELVPLTVGPTARPAVLPPTKPASVDLTPGNTPPAAPATQGGQPANG